MDAPRPETLASMADRCETRHGQREMSVVDGLRTLIERTVNLGGAQRGDF